MIRFRQINGQWYIRSADRVVFGATVQVQRLDGSTSSVIVGEQRTPANDGWYYYLFSRPQDATPTNTVLVTTDLSRIITMFNSAAQHMRRPAIVLRIGNNDVRIYPAGERTTRVPGSINVVEQGTRAWLGRITPNGMFEPARNYYGTINRELLTTTLQDFARDPHRVAAEHGRVTGHCCFCNRGLTDERSTSVGYGPICADHYGLPWGGHAISPVEPYRRQERAADARQRRATERWQETQRRIYENTGLRERVMQAAAEPAPAPMPAPRTFATEEEWQQYKREYQERETAEERRR